MTMQTTRGLAGTLLVTVTSLLLSGLLIVSNARAQDDSLNVKIRLDTATISPQSRVVRVTGTVTCSAPPEAEFDYGYGSLSVRQISAIGRGGRTGEPTTISAEGYFDLEGECEPEASFAVTITPEEGFFTPGWAEVEGYAEVCFIIGEYCDEWGCYPNYVCDSAGLSRSVKLSPSH